jgi:glycerophosphoryl diester phosphodiesterase
MLEPDVIKWAGKVQAQAVTLADFMILARPQWVSNLHAQGLEVWAYDLTPDLSQGFEHWNVESRLPVWQALKTIGVDGIESDFPEKTITLMAEMR